MSGVFESLAAVMGVAAVGGFAARILKQPPLLGYVMAGITLAVVGSGHLIALEEIMETMGQLGVTLLLFLAGMELPLTELRRMGKVAILTGVGQIIITSAAGWLLATSLGFASTTAVYMGVTLAFGSTIIVVKLLSEKGDLQSLYGKIAVGYLLVQDFVAIGMLVVLGGVSKGNFGWGELGLIMVKTAALVGVAVWLSEKVMSKALNYLATSTELLFIGSIGWCLVVAAVVASPMVGFSVEIGGFLAGMALASVIEQGQIISRVRPLRDFFLTWFFVALGGNLQLGDFAGIVVPGLILSAYVLVVNPLIVMGILGRMGYERRTLFMASLAVAQISEFSLIVIAGAVRAGELDPHILSLMTFIGVITMTLSSYMILYSDKLYKSGGWKLARLFEKKGRKQKDVEERLENHIVLFGHNRIGGALRPVLEKLGRTVLVVDFNPEIVEKLRRENVRVIFGDLSDHELYDDLNMSKAFLLVSTVPDVLDGLQFLEEVAKYKPKPAVIATAADLDGAKRLYEAGADYVLVPHLVGGEYLAHLFGHHGVDKEAISHFGEQHREKLGK